MRNGTCVKCGTATVRAARNGIVIGELPNTALRPDLGPGFRGMVRTQPTDLWAFACTTCGYLELHVLDPVGLRYIEQSWTEVPVTEDPGT